MKNRIEQVSNIRTTLYRFFVILKKNYWALLQQGNKSSPVTVLEWPTGFQEVKVPRFRDNGTR